MSSLLEVIFRWASLSLPSILPSLTLHKAVRNKYDLNVTAMPAKYRKMADFHEYYSGARRAPYLTIFIGGNHEASNHLFELYYGGWVAPNVYYMGAANILRLGPLRIAGLSGIWKGYDYRKPHFERLPYSEAETVSIFHVRELDVRKMLSVRTQVDVGLSHDWPQGVEWMGDYRWLFHKKDRFEEDARAGRLGSVAARQCLDRLRPSHWFSAHLHIKYPAIVQHGDYEPIRPQREHQPRYGVSLIDPASDQNNTAHKGERASKFPDIHPSPSFPVPTPNPPSDTAKSSHETAADAQSLQQAQISAWQNFHAGAAKSEAEDAEMRLREHREQRSEEERTGIRSTSQYIFEETWKQVQVDDGIERGIASISRSMRPAGGDVKISAMDGCCESTLKRSRLGSSDSVTDNNRVIIPPKPKNGLSAQLDGGFPTPEKSATNPIRNVDEIDVAISDSSSEDVGREKRPLAQNPSEMIAVNVEDEFSTPTSRKDSHKRVKTEVVTSDESDEGGVKLDPTTPPFVPKGRAFFRPDQIEEQIKEETLSKSDIMDTNDEQVSDEMRAQLAEISSSFAPDFGAQQVCAPLPLPESIFNTTTQFLALDKCERGRDFLQLLELEPISEQTELPNARPYRLEYDPEWLAILRVFAPELELGGDANGRIPQHKGDTHYRKRIIEEEKWIEEHVVQPGKLTIPENFAITAPIYDPDEEVSAAAMPHEYPSPQTSAFCELIGIENKFDISEEERDMRMARGPRLSERSFSRGSRGDRGGGRGGRGGGFNAWGRGGQNRGWGGRGRSRGSRGRGRGRGGW